MRERGKGGRDRQTSKKERVKQTDNKRQREIVRGKKREK